MFITSLRRRAAVAAMILCLAGCASLPASQTRLPHAPPDFRIDLLPGYRLQRQQGIDTTVWRIWKPRGLDISYDGGDLPRISPPIVKPVSEWTRLCEWSEPWLAPTASDPAGDVWCSYNVDEETGGIGLSLSFPDAAVFSATGLKSMRQVHEVLGMVLTYAPGTFDRSQFIDARRLKQRIRRGWNVKRDGPQLMQDAIYWAADEVIRTLALAGVDVNGTTADGTSYLYLAIDGDRVDSARALVESGARLTVQFLHRAVEPVWAAGRSLPMLQLFLDHGAGLNIRDERGATMLMVASGYGQTDSVNVLLELGAGIDVQDLEGSTALMSAVRCGMPAIARALVEHGASVNLRDHNGRTALGLAADVVNGLDREVSGLLELQRSSRGIAVDDDVTYFRSRLAQARDVVTFLVQHGAIR